MAGQFDECEAILAHFKSLDEQMSLAQYDDVSAGAALCMSLWHGQTGEVVPMLVALEAESPLPVTTLVAMFLARAGRVDEAREHLAERPASFEHDDWFSH